MDSWDLHYHAKGSIVRLGCQWFILVNVDDMPFSTEFFNCFIWSYGKEYHTYYHGHFCGLDAEEIRPLFVIYFHVDY